MDFLDVRINGIKINNFKNVLNGTVDLHSETNKYKASILGVYGQNGSGKTALIDSLSLLKYVLTGSKIPKKFVDYISVDSESALFVYDFLLRKDDIAVSVSYQFSIKSVIDDANNNIDLINPGDARKKIVIYDEVLKCPIKTKKQTMNGRLIDTSGGAIFSPDSKKQLLVGKNRENDMNLLVAKKVTFDQSRSFIFSREFLSVIREKSTMLSAGVDYNEFNDYHSIIESLVNFGNNCLFIVDTTTSGLISMNAQPINFKYQEDNMGAQGTIMLSLSSPSIIPEDAMDVVCKVIESMNIVLSQIVVGLTIKVKDLGKQALDNGAIGHRIELMSLKNSKEIPLSNESEGIKKIVSILQLLIVVYNQASITVAIDELDAGVFEYLLGELLRIISEKGKGQLIFTSHNLRPLETIDKNFIIFTTTNPKNRYIRLTNIKNTNNLRDLYYRDIMLSNNSDELYDHSKNSEIAWAFREAGEYSGC